MATTSVEIVWRGEVVGYINNPSVDNFHLYGRWVPTEGPVTKEFLQELARAVAAWDEELTGVSVLLGKDIRRPGEVTGFENGEINILMRPSVG